MKENIQKTLKSGDTEEWIDVVWTRPIGYMWARFFNHFDIHPNVVTILSMFLGAGAGICFYFDADTTQGIVINLVGVLLLAWANFYDSADGQLARMSGKKTRLGRILDGAAGDVWYIFIYVALVARLWNQEIPLLESLGVTWPDGTVITWGWIGFLFIAFDGLICHAGQCRISDYYRNVHLFFLKGKDGSELDNFAQQQELYNNTPWKGHLIEKFFLFTYVNWTRGQENATPNFQRLFALLRERYGDDIPQEVRDEFRKNSFPVLKWTNALTFNWRAIALYVSCLVDLPWLVIVFETVVLSAIRWHMNHYHESFCKKMYEQYK